MLENTDTVTEPLGQELGHEHKAQYERSEDSREVATL
jgi:hypothetical protein